MRYGTDFGLPAELRDDPFVESRWNELVLDAGWVTWRPYDAIETRLGRQTTWDAAGWRDYDGLRLVLQPEVAGAQLTAELWGGADVQMSAETRFASDAYDVQGLPPNDPFRGSDGPGWTYGARAGTRVDDGSFEVAWARRQYRSEGETRLGSETVGAAMAFSPTDHLTVASRASFQSILNEVDYASADISWAVPNLASIVSVGAEQRVPWFDSGSIWNVFGAQPHQGANVAYRLDLAELRQTFELQGWGRIYHGDVDATDLGSGDDDAQATGASVQHQSRFAVFGLPFRSRALVSGQWNRERAQGGDQYVADAQVGAQWQRPEVFVYLRGIGALVTPSVTSRFGEGQVGTALLGLDWDVSFGTFGFALDLTATTWRPAELSAYATFEVIQWR